MKTFLFMLGLIAIGSSTLLIPTAQAAFFERAGVNYVESRSAQTESSEGESEGGTTSLVDSPENICGTEADVITWGNAAQLTPNLVTIETAAGNVYTTRPNLFSFALGKNGSFGKFSITAETPLGRQTGLGFNVYDCTGATSNFIIFTSPANTFSVTTGIHTMTIFNDLGLPEVVTKIHLN